MSQRVGTVRLCDGRRARYAASRSPTSTAPVANRRVQDPLLEDEMLSIATRTDAPVLIIAPVDARRHIARLIHQAGSRVSGPWVEVACGMDAVAAGRAWTSVAPSGSMPTLDESFDTATGGTLFINGLERMSAAEQNRLLQHLDVLEPLDEPHRVRPVRLITGATDQLWQRVRSRGFSNRLYYRLNAVRIAGIEG